MRRAVAQAVAQSACGVRSPPSMLAAISATHGMRCQSRVRAGQGRTSVRQRAAAHSTLVGSGPSGVPGVSKVSGVQSYQPDISPNPPHPTSQPPQPASTVPRVMASATLHCTRDGPTHRSAILCLAPCPALPRYALPHLQADEARRLDDAALQATPRHASRAPASRRARAPELPPRCPRCLLPY